MTEPQEKIYVCLLDEGVDVWRPHQAQPLGQEKFRIMSMNRDPEDEKWQFMTGDIVRCEMKELMYGTASVTRLVAVEKLERRGTAV